MLIINLLRLYRYVELYHFPARKVRGLESVEELPEVHLPSPLQGLPRSLTNHRFSQWYCQYYAGVLDLEDLPLSATKINKGLLCSSPYSMHSGSIRSLRIVLPSLSELSAKSIEVHISDVQVCLRPNKQFESNFTERVA